MKKINTLNNIICSLVLVAMMSITAFAAGTAYLEARRNRNYGYHQQRSQKAAQRICWSAGQ